MPNVNGDNDNFLNKLIFSVQQELPQDKSLNYALDLLVDDKAAKSIEKGESISDIPVNRIN